MDAQSASPEKIKAYVRLLGNPYASLSLYDEPEPVSVAKPSIEQRRAYFRKLEDPHAYDSIFENTEEGVGTQIEMPLAHKTAVADALEKELDEVLLLYKPYIARNEWSRVMDYRPNFLKRANQTVSSAERAANRLRKLRFSLSPGEKVEYNRAPAIRILSELEKILI